MGRTFKTMEDTVIKITVLSEQTPKSKYFKVMKTFYKVLHYFCCLDFGFFEYKSSKWCNFWKLITILQSIILGSICLLTLDNMDLFYVCVWYYVTIIHYFLNVISLVLFNPNKTFYRLFFELDSVDLKLKANSTSFNIEIKILLIMILHLFFRTIIACFYCFFYDACLKPDGSAFLFLSLVACLYLVHITYGFLFYSIYCRLRTFASILRTASSDFSSLQQTYRSIVELTEAFKTEFDPVVAPMGLRYFRLEYVIVVEGLLLTFAPAICAGMLSSEADRIKVILHDKLMQDLDATNIREIERFIRYVEARPCRFRVWKVIPLDADLLGMVLSFCVTYLIVIIQFTNLIEMYKSAFDPLIISIGFRKNYLMSALFFGHTVAPSLCAGMLSTEVNRILVILYDMLLEERDKNKSYEIQRFIRYVEARPCRFRVWKVIPLDADLIKMVLNFCVTYLIVIIQFSNN
ncbi:Gustatory receptor 14 [Operophtera brumata]|uniref:Gustatory receptor n=1 Tax=Operophtera brumata TaxID=104452 RepID=A0A0L7KVE4_OPEBR|nr:Gustatory receptor 14 [Operophtera brumata]